MPRVKIGLIGCGAIAQVQHMPNLMELQDLFDVTTVCDISQGAAQYVAKRFHVPNWTTDYRALLDGDVDAVLHCAGGYKPDAAVAVFEAGKHLFLEKPVCASLKDIDRMIVAQDVAGKVGQTGYMKIFDPAFRVAEKEAETIGQVQFAQVNHLHPNNALHLAQFDVRHFNDVPKDVIAHEQKLHEQAVLDAIGEVDPASVRAFGVLSGSMIHDIYGMRLILGMPKQVVSTEIWREGRAITFTLEYENGCRCVASWVDLPNLWDFKESLEIYGDDKRVALSYPTGFSRGQLSRVIVQGIDGNGVTYRQEPAIDWDNAFVLELKHFYDCIVNGEACRAPLTDARDDIALIIDVIKKYSESC
ncbi:MAG: Gfo/Idh/MocA family oxidoreductase [Candidatus Latescibacteria bacterium]|jgi:predicted dehydrogenase|nr:Gfo/Idh/MocA family oxidoreductase [Candidatus Latescibacterota bacterium]MBT4139392.1 Gfo/Idh/MocA family oxidoreductase [Candidatus Latescibacterota bacterium]